MKDKPTEARRLRAPGWRDPRLIVGIILVLLSVTGVVALLQSADSRQGYWAAAIDIVPGTKVSAADFQVVQASLSESSGYYWSAEHQLPDEFLVSSTILQGEFLGQRQVIEADPDGRQQTALRVSEDMPASVTTASRADLWVSLADADGRGFEEPSKMINKSIVVGVVDNTLSFAYAYIISYI